MFASTAIWAFVAVVLAIIPLTPVIFELLVLILAKTAPSPILLLDALTELISVNVIVANVVAAVVVVVVTNVLFTKGGGGGDGAGDWEGDVVVVFVCGL